MDRGQWKSSRERRTIRATSPLYSTASKTDGESNTRRLPRSSQGNAEFQTPSYPSSFIPDQQPQETGPNSTQKEGSPRSSVQARSTPQPGSEILRRRKTSSRFFTRGPLCLASTGRVGLNPRLS